MNESRSIHAAEDWGVVLQSVPSKNKRKIVKHLEEIFEIDKHDAEQILSNMPLILVDNLSFGLAARIKKFFQKIGAVAETTNHDMIKKNCFQVLWPQTPDLSFFMKDETGPVEASVQDEKKSNAKPAEIPPVAQKVASHEMKPEVTIMHESPAVAPKFPLSSQKPAEDAPAVVPHAAPIPQKPVEELPKIVPHIPSVPAKPFQGSPMVVSHHPPVSEENQEASLSAGVDSDWERRAKELNDKLRKIHEEKQDLNVQYAEATEKVKTEFQQRLEEEKKKSEEIAKKAYEDLQKEAQKHEALTQEGEEWRSRAVSLGEKVRELETNLTQRTSAIEHLTREKEDLVRQSEKAMSETQHELAAFRSREQEFSKKIEELERNVEKMTESLCSRDSVLAQFEKQILELAEKAQGHESLRHEYAKLSQERATIRQEYDTKLAEQELRFARIEDDQRRYRSRSDRKAAAATRELGEWVRDVDGVRQGLQKLILFLGSESAVLDAEKKPHLKSPLTRGPKVEKD